LCFYRHVKAESDDDWRYEPFVDVNNIPAVAIAHLGTFAEVQLFIDILLEEMLKKNIPHLGLQIYKRYLRDRTSDEDRIRLVHAMSREMDYSGDLSNFTIVYRRAKQLRDGIAHNWGPTDRAWDAGRKKWVIILGGTRSGASYLPAPLEPEQMVRLLRDGTWLVEHARRLMYESGAFPKLLDFAQLETIPRVPPPLVPGGEPLPSPGRITDA
jgi:hypothetical protein